MAFFDNFLVYFLIVIINVSSINGQKVIKSKNEAQCPYDNSDILGAIVASVIVTIIITGLTLFIVWILWKKDYLNLGNIVTKSKTLSMRNLDKNSLVNKNDPEKGNEYAFDNPYFKDDDVDTQINGTFNSSQKLTYEEAPDFDESKTDNKAIKNGTHQINGAISNYHQNCKRLIKSLPISNVFNHISKQNRLPQNSFDDSCIMMKPEQVNVELTGHDFTGLGFNICGNMRDGIFIKDVLTRGPANESGLIKAGDRIVSITVMFDKMVYEDALTILSYASPYNVQLKIEKNSHRLNNFSNTVMATKRSVDVNTSISNQRLIHPFYRSHSVENFQKLEKDSSKVFGNIKTFGVFQKLKSHLLNRSSNNSSKSTSSDKVKINLAEESRFHSNKSNQDCCKEMTWFKEFISDREHMNQTNENSKDEVNNFENNLFQAKASISSFKVKPTLGFDEIDENVKPFPAPRKTAAGGKRKAPKPPQAISTQLKSNSLLPNEMNHNYLKKNDQVNQFLQLKTLVQVHREANALPLNEINCNEEDKVVISENEQNKIKIQEDKCSSPQTKLKSCSLSDLSNVKSRKQSSLLERAVSLDFKAQQLEKLNFDEMEDNTGLIKWNNKNNDSTSGSVSTTYSSEVISSTHKTYQELQLSIDESLNENQQEDNSKDNLMEQKQTIKKINIENEQSTIVNLEVKLKPDTITCTPAELTSKALKDSSFKDCSENASIKCVEEVTKKPSETDNILKANDKLILSVNKELENELRKDKNSNADLKDYDKKKIYDSLKISNELKKEEEERELKVDSQSKIGHNVKVDNKLNQDLNKRVSHIPQIQEVKFKEEIKLKNNLPNQKLKPNDILPKNREVVEINQKELSQVMISYEDYLKEQNKLYELSKSQFNNKSGSSIINIKSNPSNANMDFESWSYFCDDNEVNNKDLTKSSNYKTTLDIGRLTDSTDDIDNRKPGVKGVTLKVDDSSLI